MTVLITLNPGLGSNIGPNCFLSCNVAGYSQVATVIQLLEGLSTVIPDAATLIYIDSIGTCTNRLVLQVHTNTTTTTIASTTTTMPSTTTTTIPSTTTTTVLGTTTTTLPGTTTTTTAGTTTTTTVIYCNPIMSQWFQKNDCIAGPTYGDWVLYTVAAGTYCTTSLELSIALAQIDINDNGQTYANTTGGCELIPPTTTTTIAPITTTTTVPITTTTTIPITTTTTIPVTTTTTGAVTTTTTVGDTTTTTTLSEGTTTTTVADATTTTTIPDTTTTTLPINVYTLMNICVDGELGTAYETTDIALDSVAFGDRVADNSLNSYYIISQYQGTSSPWGNPIISAHTTGLTGCPQPTTTTTTAVATTTTTVPDTTTTTTDGVTTTTGPRTMLSVTVSGQGNVGTKITSVTIDGHSYISAGSPLIADVPWTGHSGLYIRSAGFDINPVDIGSGKLVSVSWDVPNLDYENSVNYVEIYDTYGGIANFSTYHYAPTTGTCSGTANIVAGDVVTIVANLDNSI